ncbi:uncharacterized protein BT62DRAFT_224302 [Guyanagaster necrorhizus]|uniref:Uncharacterized protein n=1 Tax=Guyanagaster necrorhizus TaxID=856835 RepID=A0A9P7VQ51_9AGAR|nr:uncharacterized protein BT62DRAFT_224302 [Guyanagaster necrorhizus MCA 3950]KAG7444737.1 hypothetical protein BT62DRAFT_224302 [Guyanagaster necrorhizus MCA 3950]
MFFPIRIRRCRRGGYRTRKRLRWSRPPTRATCLPTPALNARSFWVCSRRWRNETTKLIAIAILILNQQKVSHQERMPEKNGNS